MICWNFSAHAWKEFGDAGGIPELQKLLTEGTAPLIGISLEILFKCAQRSFQL
jgi:hypothetical protein